MMCEESVFHSKLESFLKLSEDDDPSGQKCRNCGILNLDRPAKKCKFHTSFFRVSIPKDLMGLVVGKKESGIEQIETASKASLRVKEELRDLDSWQKPRGGQSL